MTDDWLKRLHHDGHAELITRIKAQTNRRILAPLIALMNKQEVIMFTRMQKRYKDLAKKIARGFEANGIDGALMAITLSDEDLEKLILTTNTDTAGIAGNWQAVRLQKKKRERISSKGFHVIIEDRLEEFLLAEALASAAFVLESDRLNAAKIISRGIEEGLGEREIAKNLRQSFSGNLGVTSSRRIARTEVGIAGSKGQDEGAREIGADEKIWVAVDDARTRGHHREVDGDRVGLDEFFTPLGENMSHPHDTAHGATPRNFVNCRCALLYD